MKTKNTGVRLKRQRNGQWRSDWYGQFEDGGKKRELNLGIKWRGVPPSDRSRHPGDAEFEASRKDAMQVLDRHVKEIRRKGRVEHIMESAIESKTGRQVSYARLDGLAALWLERGRANGAGKPHLRNCDTHISRFVDFMRTRTPEAEHLFEVAPDDATAFAAKCRKELSAGYAQCRIRLISRAFERFLPVGTSNPFSGLTGRGRRGGSEVIHRVPFSEAELEVLLDVARDDPLMYPLVVTAACTGMRRGDVCRLTWDAVDLPARMLKVKTSKTGESVEIPIFERLLEVLTAANTRGRYVFPEAARMMDTNPMGLSWRFKKIIARALDDNAPSPEAATTDAAEIVDDALAAIESNILPGARRDRMERVFRRYADGESVRQIEQALGCARSTVALDLHNIQDWTGTHFMRRNAGRHSGGSITAAVARTTRQPRPRGQRAASVRDWHALRTTFVTQALSRNVSVEIIQRVTGHRTVSVVMEHYYRPNREQVRSLLKDAMPAVLSGRTDETSPEEELKSLSAKLAEGSATEADRARFKKLAAEL